MYRNYRDRAAFYVVYIEEAHASDVWQLPANLRDDVVHAAPRTAEERAALAGACVRKLNIEIPALVDHFDDSIERAYTGWPDRLYLIDRDGKVAYKSAPGPYGFRPAELEAALKKAVGVN
jgi:type I thyroxine 5'-deiodinase